MKKFLKSLPRKRYIHIVAALEQVLDLNTTSFEDILGRLKAYEGRIGVEEEEEQEDQGKLMYANMESRRFQHEFQILCKKYGIKRHLIAPYSPQQNGVVERQNLALLKITISILKQMSIPNNL